MEWSMSVNADACNKAERRLFVKLYGNNRKLTENEINSFLQENNVVIKYGSRKLRERIQFMEALIIW